MDALTRKKISRTALRKHCKKLEGDLETILTTAGDEEEFKLKALKLNYAKQIEKINAVDVEIAELLTTEADLEADISENLVLNDIFFSTLAKIDRRLEDKKLSSPRKSDSVSVAVPSESKVKLPKIELKSFDGNILGWQTFWDHYDSSIHTQPGLSEIDKFTYLKSLIKHPADECISGLALTRENYNAAVELLKQRYGNKQLLINAYMDSFVNLRHAKSMNQVSDLR